MERKKRNKSANKNTQELFKKLDTDSQLFKEMLDEDNKTPTTSEKKQKRKRKNVEVSQSPGPNTSEDEVEKEIVKKTKITTKTKKTNETPDKKKRTRNKSKEKNQKKSYTDKEAHTEISNFMKEQNRPFSVLNIVDCMKGQIKKAQCQRIMDSLVDEGVLIMKEYNTKVYLANQDQFEKVKEEDINEIEKHIEESKSFISELKEIHEKLKKEYNYLNEELSNEELDKRIADNKKEVAEMESKIKAIANRKIEQVPQEKIKEVEGNYTEIVKDYKKSKKACIYVMDTLAEAVDITRKGLIVNI
jgi:hypothetical protein